MILFQCLRYSKGDYQEIIMNGAMAVSYTHLDVYKRQDIRSAVSPGVNYDTGRKADA